MLVAPRESILAIGSQDPWADLATQRQFDATSAIAVPDGDWELIEGEVISFADPQIVLPRLDRFEDFRPGEADTTYLRALLRVSTDRSGVAWTYIAPNSQAPAGARPVSRRWP
jgi:hypothetical protein